MEPLRPPIDEAALARELAALEASLGAAAARNAADAADLEDAREDIARIERDLRAYAERRRLRADGAPPSVEGPAAPPPPA